MKLKTKVNVNYNTGVIGGQSGILFGKINSVTLLSNFNAVDVQFHYEKEDGLIVFQNYFQLFNEEIDNMSLNIFENLPENYNELSERERMTLKYYSGFALKMAETFAITTNDIEFID